MELQQNHQNELDHATIPAWCSAFLIYSCCEDEEQEVYFLFEEIEPVKKAVRDAFAAKGHYQQETSHV